LRAAAPHLTGKSNTLEYRFEPVKLQRARQLKSGTAFFHRRQKAVKNKYPVHLEGFEWREIWLYICAPPQTTPSSGGNQFLIKKWT
jgi:hypothetical protein